MHMLIYNVLFSNQIYCLGSLQEILPKRALRQMLVFSVCILTKQKVNIDIQFPNYPNLRLVGKMFSYIHMEGSVCAHMYSIGHYTMN